MYDAWQHITIYLQWGQVLNIMKKYVFVNSGLESMLRMN